MEQMLKNEQSPSVGNTDLIQSLLLALNTSEQVVQFISSEADLPFDAERPSVSVSQSHGGSQMHSSNNVTENSRKQSKRRKKSQSKRVTEETPIGFGAQESNIEVLSSFQNNHPITPFAKEMTAQELMRESEQQIQNSQQMSKSWRKSRQDKLRPVSVPATTPSVNTMMSSGHPSVDLGATNDKSNIHRQLNLSGQTLQQ